MDCSLLKRSLAFEVGANQRMFLTFCSMSGKRSILKYGIAMSLYPMVADPS
jgi:hypothetical protein